VRGQRIARSERNAQALRISPSGTLIVEGFGTSLSVEAGQLVVRTGTGRTIRTGRFERARRPKLRRLVIVGRTGVASLPALDWVRQVGASWTWIGRDGEVLATSAALGLDDGRLRRAQALASLTETGICVVRHLLHEKVSGQLRVLGGHFPAQTEAADTVEAALQGLADAESMEQLRLGEAQAAAGYWSGWRGLSLGFARRDLGRVPPRWTQFESRASLITGNPRLASDPIGSMLNLAYALLESEARIGLAAVGLDGGMAFGLHSDQRSRANGALDLMEAARPAADEAVLVSIRSRVFRRGDFHELPNGVCRIAPELARSLIEAWVPSFSQAIGPQAERVAAMLGDAAGMGRLPTRLTGSNRSAGRDRHRRAQPRRSGASRHAGPLPSACVECGLVLEGTGRTYCDECLPAHTVEKLSKFSAAGPAALAEMRAAGRDPASTPEARAKLSGSMSRRGLNVAAWDREHGDRPDPEVFRMEILPGLQGVPLARIVVRTGLSLRYASLIRRGEKVPHPMHWEALRGIAAAGQT